MISMYMLTIMTKTEIKRIEKKIDTIQKKLSDLGPMRPGNLGKQYRDRKNKKGVYYQLSYTHKMKSRTEHVRPEHLKLMQKEIDEYKRYKKLVTDLIDLSIECSKAKIAYLRGQ